MMKHIAAIPIAALVIGALAASKPGAPRLNEVRLSTGVTIQYAEQGNPGGEPVILLHGYSDSWFSWSRALPHFPARYRVYALSMRGHGDSERPASGYHMRDLAADVIAFMDEKKIVRANVVGHSMGSLVAQQVALAAPRRVSHLVLVGSAPSIAEFAGVSDLKPVVEALADPVPVDFVREFQKSTVTAPVPDAFMNTAIAESGKLPARVWRDLLAGMLATDRAVALGRSGIPTLLMWGDKDAYATRPAQDSLLAMIRTAELRAYENTGHAPHWERPRDFTSDLVAFLGRTPSGEGVARK
jgi:pimeloyl-ACP methyl ester carboxylesterase